MSSGSAEGATAPSDEDLARANVEAIARVVTPDRTPPTVAFTSSSILARFHFASDTIWLERELIPVIAQGTEAPVVRALVAHELGHRRDGQPGISGLPIPVLLALTALLMVACAAFVLDLGVVGVAAAGVAAAAFLALLVRARWAAEYRCDDFAAERTGPDGVITLLEFLAQVDREGRLRGGPRRWLRMALRWVTHPPSSRRVQRQRARVAAGDDQSLPPAR